MHFNDDGMSLLQGGALESVRVAWPDLVLLVVTEDMRAMAASKLPELPAARAERFERELGLPPIRARDLAFRRELADGPGFRTSHIAKITIDAGQARYTDAQSARFFDRALDVVKADPAWRCHEVASGHDVMVDQPDLLCEILLEAAG